MYLSIYGLLLKLTLEDKNRVVPQHLAGGVATDLGEVFWKSRLCDITED